MGKLKVVYWNNMPSPYMVDRFNALAERGTMAFEAWFNDRIEPNRTWLVEESAWKFPYRYVPSTRIGSRVLHWPWLLLQNRPDVLISLHAEPVFLFGWLLARCRGIKTGFRVLLTHDRWIRRHPLKEAIKRFLFSRVDFIETPGPDGRLYAMRYGAPPERVFIATHTVDLDHFQRHSTMTDERRTRLRSELGLHGTVFVYVGRLWWGKGIYHLLEAFESVQRDTGGEASLLLCGDGPEQTALQRVCGERNIPNVIFAGFRQKSELPRFYGIADVFVFPTLGDPYGIVVDEAMACGLPVVTTSAAGEIRYRIENGVNGFIVPPEDSTALSEKMLLLASNPEMRRAMGKRSRQSVATHTPMQWALDFEGIVSALLDCGELGPQARY